MAAETAASHGTTAIVRPVVSPSLDATSTCDETPRTPPATTSEQPDSRSTLYGFVWPGLTIGLSVIALTLAFLLLLIGLIVLFWVARNTAKSDHENTTGSHSVETANFTPQHDVSSDAAAQRNFNAPHALDQGGNQHFGDTDVVAERPVPMTESTQTASASGNRDTSPSSPQRTDRQPEASPGPPQPSSHDRSNGGGKKNPGRETNRDSDAFDTTGHQSGNDLFEALPNKAEDDVNRDIALFPAAVGDALLVKATVPDSQSLQRARELALGIYRDDLATAVAAADKLALAQQLRYRAALLDNDPVGRFTLLEIARDLGVEAGDSFFALEVVGDLDRWYDVDALPMKTAILSNVARRPLTTEGQATLAQSALGVADEAAERDQFDIAVRVSEGGVSVARKSHDHELIREAVRRASEMRQRAESHERFCQAMATLTDDAANATANQTVGNFLCFSKNQFEEGLPYLAKGTDDMWRQLVAADLVAPTATDERLQLANRWWSQAESVVGEEQSQCRRRAKHWYHLAVPDLTGLEQELVRRRISEVDLDQNSLHPALAIAPFTLIEAKAQQSNWARHTQVPVTAINSIGISFKLIPPGEFPMGSRQEEVGREADETLHTVTISRPFYMASHEVTVGQFARFAIDRDYRTKIENAAPKGANVIPRDRWSAATTAWLGPHSAVPVVNVSWSDAAAFCEWLSEKEGKHYRLPTEAEWEFSCRGGSLAPLHFNKESKAKAYAWLAENSEGEVQPVGQLKPNPFGLYDMHGNVWEWCGDWYGKYSDMESPVDPQGPHTGGVRIIRGGAADSRNVARAAYRDYADPHYGARNIGLRIVCEVNE